MAVNNGWQSLPEWIDHRTLRWVAEQLDRQALDSNRRLLSASAGAMEWWRGNVSAKSTAARALHRRATMVEKRVAGRATEVG
jgi:hypothetical protein